MKKFIIIGVVIIVLFLGYSMLPSQNDEILNSGIFGQVFLGPICPAMKEGDDSCKDRTYQTAIEIAFQRTGSDKASLYETIETDEAGKYEIMLPSRTDGLYLVRGVGADPFPHCETKRVTVEPDVMLEVRLLCDTGIRMPSNTAP